MMRIAIECSPLVAPPFSGIARCTRQMILALAQAQDTQLTLCCPNSAQYRRHRRALPSAANIEVRPSLPGWPLWRDKTYDIGFLSFNRDLPPRIRAPRVLWLHDFYLHWGYSNLDPVLRLGRMADMARVYAAASHFICISKASRQDALLFLPVQEDQLHLVPEGVGPDFSPATAAQRAALRARLGQARPYFLFVGMATENKNLARLLAAFAASPLQQEMDLLIAGSLPPQHPDVLRLRQQIAQFGLGNTVKLVGKVSDTDLVTLYSEAAAYVFPSFCEGFGLPMLEAMRCGTPVLTASRSACAEVALGHAELADPFSVEDLGRGLRSVLGRTQSQRDAARAYAQDMSWARAAGELRAVFEKIAGS